MVVIAKIFGTYFFSRNLSLSPKKVYYSPKQGTLLHKELGPFPKETSLLPREVAFSPKNFFYSMGNLLGTNT
jgi:hypothetical protein